MNVLIQTLSIAASCSGRDGPARPAWLAIALVHAVQGACALALSVYETADPGDVLAPAGAGGDAGDGEVRVAPLALLLRRVRSPDSLEEADRPPLPASARRALLALAAYRNRVMHRVPADDPRPPDGFPGAIAAACDLIDALLVRRPAFDSALHPAILAAIAHDLAAIRQAAGEGGARVG